MGIVAYCPNGHRIKVKDELAGKKGICPTCAARFRIPLARPGRIGTTTTPAAAHTPHAVPRDPHAAADGVTGDDIARDAAAGAQSAARVPTAGARGALEEHPDLVWCVAERGGTPSAPLDTTGMRAWLDSGAATAEHVVWRADWPEWRPVEEVFPGTLPPAGRRGT